MSEEPYREMRSILRAKFFRQQSALLHIMLFLQKAPSPQLFDKFGFEKGNSEMEWVKESVVCHISVKNSRHPNPNWMPDVVMQVCETEHEDLYMGGGGDDLLAKMSKVHKVVDGEAELSFLYPEAATLCLGGKGSVEQTLEICETLSLMWGDGCSL